MKALRVYVLALAVFAAAFLVVRPASARVHELDWASGSFPAIAPLGGEEVLLVAAERTAQAQVGDAMDLHAVVWNVRTAKVVRRAKVAQVRAYSSQDFGTRARVPLLLRVDRGALLFLDGVSAADPERQIVEIDDALKVTRRIRTPEKDVVSSAVAVSDRSIATLISNVEGDRPSAKDNVRVVLRDRQTLGVTVTRVLAGQGSVGTTMGAWGHGLALSGDRLFVAFREGRTGSLAILRASSLAVERRRTVTNDASPPAVAVLPDRVVVLGETRVELSPDADRVLRENDASTFAATIIVADSMGKRFASDLRVRAGFPASVIWPRESWSGPVDVAWTATGAVSLGFGVGGMAAITDPFR